MIVWSVFQPGIHHSSHLQNSNDQNNLYEYQKYLWHNRATKTESDYYLIFFNKRQQNT